MLCTLATLFGLCVGFACGRVTLRRKAPPLAPPPVLLGQQWIFRDAVVEVCDVYPSSAHASLMPRGSNKYQSTTKTVAFDVLRAEGVAYTDDAWQEHQRLKAARDQAAKEMREHGVEAL